MEIAKRLGENVTGQYPGPIEDITWGSQESMERIRDDMNDGRQIMLLTQADIDRIYNMIDSATYSPDFDDVLTNIIIEEAEDYFRGTKNAEEAARVIQSRVSIYLAERN